LAQRALHDPIGDLHCFRELAARLALLPPEIGGLLPESGTLPREIGGWIDEGGAW